MNVIFISPHFPTYYYQFCERLKSRGVHVLGIGDASYQSLDEKTRQSVTEYYYVESLEDEEEVYRACAYFIWKYGKIDWIESQNEYWLELEAKLRTEFNVQTGVKIQDLAPMKYKSKMKSIYESIGLKTARYHLIHDYESTIHFISQVGYPVVVKPDNGVGASFTYKLNNQEELHYFFATKPDDITFIMEEYVPGHVETFDGITDKEMNILVSTSHVMLNSIMDNVNEARDTAFYSQPVENLDVAEIGKKVVQAFQTKSRFFHFEFFRLDEDKDGLGKKGDLLGLEVNMRAPGAFIPEMMNMAYDVDVYTIWADMLIYNHCFFDIHRRHWVAYVGRRQYIDYMYSNDDIYKMYHTHIALNTDVPTSLASAMGDYVYIVKGETQEDIFKMISSILKRKDGTLGSVSIVEGLKR